MWLYILNIYADVQEININIYEIEFIEMRKDMFKVTDCNSRIKFKKCSELLPSNVLVVGYYCR
jgi:hypothetical protein